jgi:hypothetical protein
MCLPGKISQPSCAADAVAMARAGLAWLASADATALPADVQAECLRGLEHIGAVHTAARASVLAGFTAQSGYEKDGHGSARTWLKWQCQMTPGAAAGAVGWMRRLDDHSAVRRALAAGQVSESFARAICRWTGNLPEALRGDADAILLEAAGAGAELSDLAALAEEIRHRTAGPDKDGDGFEDRWVRLEETFRGTGSLSGELTPQCQAALRAVLDSLGKKAGPEDTRSRAQREHDALEEACRRLVGSACLPDRAGQPTQIQLSMTLDRLRRQDDAAARPGPWPAAGPGDDCDASIVPVVTGHVDHDLLDRLATALADGKARAAAPAAEGPRAAARRQRCESAARRLLLQWATGVLSGPGGVAAYLRSGLPEDLVASVSLPLDVGAITETIPVHLRRAVARRDRRCRFPGCDQPVAACQVHHVVPRSQGGPTKLTGLILLCSFHHLIAVHRWGWRIELHPDGTVTAVSPDGTKHLRSHAPPGTAA